MLTEVFGWEDGDGTVGIGVWVWNNVGVRMAVSGQQRCQNSGVRKAALHHNEKFLVFSLTVSVFLFFSINMSDNSNNPFANAKQNYKAKMRILQRINSEQTFNSTTYLLLSFQLPLW